MQSSQIHCCRAKLSLSVWLYTQYEKHMLPMNISDSRIQSFRQMMDMDMIQYDTETLCRESYTTCLANQALTDRYLSLIHI